MKTILDIIGKMGNHISLVISISELVREMPGNELIIGSTSLVLNNKRFKRNNEP
jgi:hypothetical protein